MKITARTLPSLICTVTLLLSLQASATSVPRGTISDVRIANVSDKGFTVSWTTNVAAAGRVNYGSTPALGSSRADDPDARPYTHHVSLGGLNPSTSYYFDVVSDGYTDDNGGSHYSVTTGPTLAIPGMDTVYGQVFRPGGVTPVAGAIVYVTVADRNGSGGSGRSAALSALSDADGYWFANLASVRTASHAGYFSYSAAGGDDLELQADDGPPGRAALTVDLGQSYVAGGYRAATPPLILSLFNLSGVVTLDGAAVAAGTTIAAWCGGSQRVATAAYLQADASWYALDAPGDDPATPGVREGCIPSETVTFKVGAHWSEQAVPWVSGSLALTLTAVSATPPAPVPPRLDAAAAGGGVQLSWREDEANRSYELWRSTAPYFTPGAAGTEILANALSDCSRVGGVITCQDAGALGEAATNYFYFALQPGQ